MKLDNDVLRQITSSHNLLLNLHTTSEVLIGEEEIFEDIKVKILEEKENMYYCITHILEK